MLRVHRDKDSLLRIFKRLIQNSTIGEECDIIQHCSVNLLEASTFTSDSYTIYWSQY